MGKARSTAVNEAVETWLNKRRSDEPVFLWVHTIDPHLPYQPPEPFKSRFAADVEDPTIGATSNFVKRVAKGRFSARAVADVKALYAAEVAANDDSFGRFLELLATAGLEDDAIVIFLSDHGEEFMDHGDWTHGKTLHAEVLDTPLVVRLPGQTAGVRIAGRAQHVDLMPTVLDLVGLEGPAGTHGRSLVPLLRAEGGAPSVATSYLDLRGRQMSGLLLGSWKLIQRDSWRGSRSPLLFDLAADPLEAQSLASERLEVLAHLEAVARLGKPTSVRPSRRPLSISPGKRNSAVSLRRSVIFGSGER